MFSLSYYNASPKELKAEEVFTSGSFIDEYLTDETNQTIALYSLNTFYEEVTFDNKANKVVMVQGIKVDGAIKKYALGTPNFLDDL